MSKANDHIAYRKLPGRSSTARLMQGPDHLLLVKNSSIVHQYRRFYFKDIQSIVLLRTRRQLTYSILLAVPLSLFGLRILFAGWITISGFLFVTGSLLLLANVLAGPCCAGWIQTRISRERLPVPRRLRRAQRVCDRLHARITSEQGPFEPAAYETALQQPLPQRTISPPVATPVRRRPLSTAAARRPVSGHSMTAFALLLLGCAVATAPNVFGRTFRVLPILLHLAAVAMLVVLLIRYASRKASGGMRWVGWAALGYFAVFLFMAIFAAAVFSDRSLSPGPGVYKALRVALAFHVSVLTGLGITGLIQVWRYRVGSAAQPHSVSTGTPHDPDHAPGGPVAS